MLWSHFEDSNLLEPMQTRLTWCNRTDREAMNDDILRGIGSLIENGIKVQCIARVWKLIPKSHPEGVNELSIAEKLADLEGKLKVLVDTLDGTKFDVVTNSQKISAMETDSKLHGQLIQQVLVKTNIHNAKYPSLAEVFAGGSSNRPLQMTGGTNRDGAPDSNDNDQCERKEEADHESQPIPVSPRIDSTTQQLRDTFVIPADQRRKQNKQLQRENRSKQPRNTQMRGTIIGQGIDAAGVTMVPPPDRDFFICRVHKSDAISEVGEYITRKGVKFRKLTKASNDNAKLNSFKLTIPVDDINKVKDPLLWPKGWNVRRWYVKAKSESIRNNDVVSLCESLQ